MKKGEYKFPNWLSGQESIVDPKAMSAPLDAKGACICFEDAFYKLLIDSLDLVTGEDMKGFSATIKGMVDDEVGVFHSFFGAPASSMLLETLIASGVERVIMFGEAGSISRDCKVGDILIPTWGLREEGTSYHYLTPEVQVKPTSTLLRLVRNRLKGFEYHEGGIWTTDAGLRETPDKVDDYSKKGVKAVEMECTALMAVSIYRNIEFASILVITDEVRADGWFEDFRGKGVKESKEKICSRVDRSLLL